ncbi:MAG: SRPBCC family protein [Bacteroidota bacterium]
MAYTTVSVVESIFINTSVEELWNITALQFDKIGLWSAGVKDAIGYGTGFNGSVCTERQCIPAYKGFKKTTERIIDYQPDKKQFTYQIAQGLPKMVVEATNTWTHLEEGNGTKITMEVYMELKGLIGNVMKGPLKKKMSKILKENLEELKAYAETGTVHTRKQKLIAQEAK